MATSTRPVDLDEVIVNRALRSVFQPIVELSTAQVVGVEALTRGPAGSELESPSALFDAAHVAGRTAELDWRCRATAIRAVSELGRSRPGLLFINAEPSSFGAPPPSDVLDDLALGDDLDIVVEVTERDLLRDPAAMLAALRAARRRGHRIALDDVGADSASLALMPAIDPDVIKLDLRLVQSRTDGDVSEIACAVMAQAERTGAKILAEGIETTRHLEIARALGADLGQGYLFGRPSAVVADTVATSALRALLPVPVPPTPWQSVPRGRETRIASKGHLLALSRHLEQLALHSRTPPLLAASFQHGRNMTLATSQRYLEVARRCSLVVATGAEMPRVPVPGVRGVDVPADHPLNQEWVVATLGAHEAAALIARDLGDDADDLDRRFEFTLTHRREVVTAAVRSMLAFT
jgi:EAL domain-containing protein (putative c-di-GMP-specific phosphodiesterase class I)